MVLFFMEIISVIMVIENLMFVLFILEYMDIWLLS